MSIESPSGHDFKKLGKILFYVLILPALFYYIWQGLKALFGLLAAAFEFSEERKPLINACATSHEDNPLLLRVVVDNTSSHLEYNVSDTFGEDLCKKDVLKMKQIVAEKTAVDFNAIRELQFFRKKPLSPVQFLEGDPSPADSDRKTACYLKVTPLINISESDSQLSKKTYWFKYIEGSSSAEDAKNIGTKDTFLQLKEKISLRINGKKDGKIRVQSFNVNLASHLDNENRLDKWLEFKPNTICDLQIKAEWKAGHSEKDDEDADLKIMFKPQLQSS